MLLEIVNASKSFAQVDATGAATEELVQVLSDVTFSLDRGKSLAIVAPSGAGKSTLLSIAGLLLRPTSGDVLIDGESTAAMPDDARSALRAGKIGFLFQHTQLVGSLRAIENVVLPAEFAAMQGQGSAAGTTERAAELLAQFGLAERMYHFPSQLSVGQKRRIATARALIAQPDLIIADEPTNDLDPENAAKVVDALFAPVVEGRAGLLIATHDAELAERADAVFRLS